MNKSTTDVHWNERALSEKDDSKVNIADVAQRELENAFILPNVPAGGRVLEVGCGNGFLTRLLRQRAGFVDAFDYAENMISRARELYGEANNRFFHDNVLDASRVAPPYDGIVCVRVLINLRDTGEQQRALRNMASWLRSSGTLILIEGYRDGFDKLNELRRETGIPPLTPAAINHYSRLEELKPIIDELFRIKQTFHTGMFDFLTRIVYPALVGGEQATGYADFHDKILPIARHFNPTAVELLSRLRGFVLEKL